ncbi:MAG: magnetochrome domain-containing protein [Candidatus Omnitrophica bacterium]|nr:magnetochrome domain-containing protein [Candidatus Omnitrophota bacterium]
MVKKPQGKSFEKSFEEFMSKFKNTDLNTFFIFGAILVVLIVGLYALFSPDAKNAMQGNPACGMIVIATDGQSLASNVAPTLNEARYFLVVNPLSGKLVEAVKNPYRGGASGTQLVYLVASKGEEAVIVGNIVPQDYNILMQFGIRVFGGYQGRAQKVVKLYRQARISASPQPVDGTVQPAYVPVQTPQGVVDNTQVAFGQGGQYMQGQGMGNNPYCPIPRMQAGAQSYNQMAPQYQNFQAPQGVVENTQVAYGQGGQYMQGQGMGNNPYCPIPRIQAGAMQGQAGMYQQPGYYQQPNNMQPTAPQYNQMAPQYQNFQYNVQPNGYYGNGNYGNQAAMVPAQNQNAYYGNGNYGNQVAMTQPTTQAPPITRDATLPHAYRGVCSNCHQILESSMGAQNNQNMMQNNQTQQNFAGQQDPNSARIVIGGGK